MNRGCRIVLALVVLVTLAEWSPARAAPPLPAPARDLTATGEVATAVLAAGCFWCVEAVFEPVRGVTKVVSGYAGGDARSARYDWVSAGRTDHAEAVEITYDPRQVSYGKLLQMFFTIHDPTQKDRQGPDRGRQYRSAIFYATESQREIAAAYRRQLTEAGAFSRPIATTLEPLTGFYPAEEYHQDYVARHPLDPYVRAWVPAKLETLRRFFPEWTTDCR
jgi:peptide-methionine (S)-S-oxide reductase